jgi:replication factor C subunit 3/5
MFVCLFIFAVQKLVAMGIGLFPSLLLYGPPGTGKTTAALACTRVLYPDAEDRRRLVLVVNASDDRGIGTVRETIVPFVQTRALFVEGRQVKCVVLDEVDAMTADAQCALRLVIEANTAVARFILLCNDTTKLMQPLVSRCTCLRFRPLAPALCVRSLQAMAAAEGVEVTPDAAKGVVHVCGGDMRRAVNMLQTVAVMAQGAAVTPGMVYAMTGLPSPADVDALFAAVCGSPPDLLRVRVTAATEFMAKHQIALSDVLDALTVCVIQHPPATTAATATLLSGLCDIQWRLTNIGVSDRVQLAAAAALFADAYRGGAAGA